MLTKHFARFDHVLAPARKNQIATLHNSNQKASIVLSLTSVNGISNLDFVIVSYKKIYLA